MPSKRTEVCRWLIYEPMDAKRRSDLLTVLAYIYIYIYILLLMQKEYHTKILKLFPAILVQQCCISYWVKTDSMTCSLILL